MHNINKTKREDEEVEEKAYTKQKLIEIPKPTIRSTKLINFLCEFAKINKQIRGRIYLLTKNIPRWVDSSAVFNVILVYIQWKVNGIEQKNQSKFVTFNSHLYSHFLSCT